jgi:uncharacterized protein
MHTIILALSFAAAHPSAELDQLAQDAPPAAAAVSAPLEPMGEVLADTDRLAAQDKNQISLRTAAHPNESYRVRGAAAAAAGRWEHAADMFRTAARYADKYSQHRLSLLHWYGVGVPQDRVQGYLWADIAAERGYQQFLAIRERMWHELTPEEQAAVPQRGPALYAEFGDPVAKKRFDVAMIRVRHNIVTGSRTGFAGWVGTNPPEFLAQHLGRMMIAKPEDFTALGLLYKRDRLDRDAYWKQEDLVWTQGEVVVGDLEDTSSKRKASNKPQPTP